MATPVIHVVLMKLREGIDESKIEATLAALGDLQHSISGLRSFKWGPNASPEGMGAGYDVGFVMEFDDASARDAYLPHPDHVDAGALVKSISDRVLVFDIES